MKVLFLHGLESQPGGKKATFLKENGHEVSNPALPKEPFNIAVKIAEDVINYEKPDVVVGSSRGGAVAMAANTKDCKVILIAPAWRRFGVSKTVSPGTVILHSESDDVVPFEDTQELFRSNTGLEVIACEDTHRMSSDETLRKILECVNSFVEE
tara:strand:+ start:641 stop:1102 length:462 start_codon:yes stop_codon:yes gene_type:complete